MRLLLVILLLLPELMRAGDDWRLALRQVRHKVLEAVTQSSNYICVQDVSRFYYETKTPAQACEQTDSLPPVPLQAEDRLKLDVAVSEGAEIYSWHGEHKFATGTMDQLVRRGPVSTGGFNGYLRNVFNTEGVTFLYRGISTADGVEVYGFDYEVPLAVSRYQVQSGRGTVLIPFHGSFAARTSDSELYSLTVSADGPEMVKKADICSIRTKLTYQLVRISNHDSLLPASFDLRMGTRQLIFTESKGRYSECRAYTGESTVHFEDMGSEKQNTTPALADPDPVRPGVVLQIALRSTIDEDSAYAGQPVEAVLIRNAKFGKQRVLHRGAVLRGTITGFQIFEAAPHHVKLNIEFTSIADGTDLYVCSAIHSNPIHFPQQQGLQQMVEEDLEDGTMLLNMAHVHLDQKFTSLFVTVDQSGPASR